MERLNLGCGGHLLEGWVNADFAYQKGITYVDARRPLPFEAQTFSLVYSSHMLEHLGRAEARQLVREVFRVLRPGGVARIVVPDLEQICRLYLGCLDDVRRQASPEAEWRLDWMRAELLDQLVRTRPGGSFPALMESPHADREFMYSRFGDIARSLEVLAPLSSEPATARVLRKLREPLRTLGQVVLRVRAGAVLSRDPRRTGEAHRWMYDESALARLMDDAGFREPRVMTWDRSRAPGWTSQNPDQSQYGVAPRKPDSLYIEAVRPLD